jgi:hypothetical protein
MLLEELQGMYAESLDTWLVCNNRASSLTEAEDRTYSPQPRRKHQDVKKALRHSLLLRYEHNGLLGGVEQKEGRKGKGRETVMP